METMEALLTRRSIRKYQSRPVSEEDLQSILEAAMCTPSARNQQPWHFVVIRDRVLLDRIPEAHPYSSMMREVSLAVLVCCDPALEKTEGYWVQDCAAATENLLLAVHALGLAGVWLGVYPREERMSGLGALFSLPRGIIPFSLIPIGYPAETKGREERYRVDRIHLNRW